MVARWWQPPDLVLGATAGLAIAHSIGGGLIPVLTSRRNDPATASGAGHLDRHGSAGDRSLQPWPGIVELSSGQLLACWDSGSFEANPEVVMLTRRHDADEELEAARLQGLMLDRGDT
jgi:hypothetical protein